MTDLSWLSQEAKTLHAMFEQLFYGLAVVLLLIGVVMEYFKIAIGGIPQFPTLAGRLLIAAVLLNSYPEVSNLIADVTDAIANQIGSLNSIHLVLSKYWDKLQHLHASLTSLKDSVLMLISFVTFFLLYISVYIADAAITYVWVILYVFSPILIALYVLPATAGATKSLYRSLFEVGAWKIVWSVLATLLWSAALSQINQAESDINFITAVSFNLILAASLLLTPFVVNALAGAGITSLGAQTAGMAAGAAAFSPGPMLTNAAKKKLSGRGGGGAGGIGPSGGFPNKFMESGKTTRTSKAQSSRSGPTKQPQPKPEATPQGANATITFKAAVENFRPPPNRSDYKKQPIQQAAFREARAESRKPNGDSNK